MTQEVKPSGPPVNPFPPPPPPVNCIDESEEEVASTSSTPNEVEDE